jgi:4-hydroxy-3-polyprenylbenzoate decarboxylase
MAPKDSPTARYRDLRAHIAMLEHEGLLHRIDAPINKDTEMHPLVRWQYRGGVPDAERKAFLFTNVTDSLGRKYDMPVLVAGLAGSRRIYGLGMQCGLDEVGARWDHALANPIEPVMWDGPAPAQEVVHGQAELESWGGLLRLPTPISTPGWDNAPYLTAAHFITKDPETGVRNAGNYRGQIKSAIRCGVRFSGRGCDAAIHWQKAKQRGKHLEVAIVIGAPPIMSFTAVQRMPIELDELAVAGALAGGPIPLVKCKTVDLEVPAESEIVIEGIIRSDFLEPEGPFGESTGFVHQRTDSHVIEVTCITHRRDPIFTSFISQVTPSESSTIKVVAYEPMILNFLRNTCGVKSVVKVVMHEALTNLRPVVFLQFHAPTDGDVWRALKLASSFHNGVGKIVIAVDEDIDPSNLDAILWSLAYRMTPHKDVQIVRGFNKVGPPFRDVPAMENSVMLINATLREKMPPVSLPKREFMEHSLELWRKLGLPPITPQAPWFGYSLGEWWDELDEEAKLATEGRWTETGEKNLKQRKPV